MTLERLGGDIATVELFAAGAGATRWDDAAWDDTGVVWTDETWQDVACEVRGFDWADGADRAVGVLSNAAGGQWTCELYDPTRKLDPSNPSAAFGRAVQPGRYIRFGYPGGFVGQGLIDSAAYEVAGGLARLRGTDYVGVLSAMEVDPPPATVDHLRELARYVVAEVGLAILTVEDDPPEGDPAIGDLFETPTGALGAWDAIAQGARDALQMAYIDRNAVIRFRPHSDPEDVGLAFGCEGIPLIGLAAASTGDGILNRILARDTVGGPVIVQEDVESIKRYGVRDLDRTDRRVPNAATWAAAVIADRAFASLEYLPVQAWPTTVAQLDGLFAAPMVAAVRIRADAVDPPVAVDARLIARGCKVTPDGWTLDALTYVSNGEWSDDELPPAEPDPDPPGLQTVLRTGVSTKVARFAKFGGIRQGAGAQTPCPVGAFAGWTNRMGVHVPITLTDCYEVIAAVLRVRTSTQVHASFGAAPAVRARRITAPWIEGTATSPSAGNASIWPGPTSSANGESVTDVPATTGATVDLDVTRIVRAWAPKRAGGNERVNHGILLQSYVESDPVHTTELETDDAGTAAWRPELRVTLRVPA